MPRARWEAKLSRCHCSSRRNGLRPLFLSLFLQINTQYFVLLNDGPAIIMPRGTVLCVSVAMLTAEARKCNHSIYFSRSIFTGASIKFSLTKPEGLLDEWLNCNQIVCWVGELMTLCSWRWQCLACTSGSGLWREVRRSLSTTVTMMYSYCLLINFWGGAASLAQWPVQLSACRYTPEF